MYKKVRAKEREREREIKFLEISFSTRLSGSLRAYCKNWIVLLPSYVSLAYKWRMAVLSPWKEHVQRTQDAPRESKIFFQLSHTGELNGMIHDEGEGREKLIKNSIETERNEDM